MRNHSLSFPLLQQPYPVNVGRQYGHPDGPGKAHASTPRANTLTTVFLQVVYARLNSRVPFGLHHHAQNPAFFPSLVLLSIANFAIAFSIRLLLRG